MSHRWVIVFCLIVSYLTLFYKLGSPPFIGSDEPRYATIAKEMAQRGEYVTPTLNGRPWLEKPPLLFWLEALSFKRFGISEWSARLPSALLALLGSCVVGFFAASFGGARTGVLTFLILLTSEMYVAYARIGSTDLPLTVSFTTANVFAFLGTKTGSLWRMAASGAALACVVLAKGPLYLGLFLGIFGFLFFLSGRRLWTVKQCASAGTVFLVSVVPWFWLVWSENGDNFLITFFLNHHVARLVTDLHHHSQPIWFYIPFVLVGFFPWIFFLGSAIRRAWRRRSKYTEERNFEILFLWLWVAVPFLFFSISSSKLPGYILPVLPPLAILVALEWERILEAHSTTDPLLKAELTSLQALSLILALSLVLGFHFNYRSLKVGILVGLPILLSSFWTRFEFRKGRLPSIFLTLIAGMVLTTALLYWKAAPIIGDYHSGRDLVRMGRPSISESEPLIFYRFFHNSARYYADYYTTRDSVNNPEELRAYILEHPQDRYLILTTDHGRVELSPLYRVRLLGHRGKLYLFDLRNEPAVGPGGSLKEATWAGSGWRDR